MTANQMRQDVKHTNGDARLDALAAATTGLAVKNAIDAVAANPSAVGGIGISVSLGTSHSNSNSNATSSTAVGSSVTAGHNLTIAAAGGGADSDINVIGSTLSAGNNTTLIAAGDINLHAAQNTDSVSSTNSGSSASIGATLSLGQQNGLSFQVGVSGTKGNGNGSETTWTNTHVTAGNTLTLQSGGDTNLIGAVADAQHVVANVGGDLNIASLQDVSHYDSKQVSGGVSISVCVPPICYGGSSVAANFSQEKMNSDYASVTGQSGIHAGDGGFQINVKGNTDLKGAVISSSDQAILDGLNSLSTATLTHSDIQNQAAYDASSLGISGAYGGGAVGKDQQGVANNTNPVGGTELPGINGIKATPPVVMSASGDASSTTTSAISGGAITITDGVKQQQLTGQTAEEAVAGISRDTTSTTNTIAPIFDKDKIEAGFDITSQFINQVGTFVNNRAKEADKAAEDAKDPKLTPEQRAEAQKLADQLNAQWGPGGSYRQVLDALTVAAGGNVTGGAGQFVQAGLVNYIQQQGAAYLGTLVAKGELTEGSPIHAALHAILGCAGAAASGQNCGAGAMGAATASLLTNLFTDDPNESAQEREAKSNLITSLVAGLATASGIDAAPATGAAQAATNNNYLTQKQQQARALANANCDSSGDPAACRQQVKQEFAKLWEANEAAANGCASAQACAGVLNDLHGQQQEYAARENELQAKLANGSISSAELAELTSLRASETQLVALQSEALGNLTKVGGLNALGSAEAAQLISNLGIGAAPGIGEGLAAGAVEATKGGKTGAGAGGGEPMLGANGPKFGSMTLWNGDGKERIDVENPNPGQRPGQIHYQDNQGNKYLYDPNTNTFPDAPNSVNKLLENPKFSAAIEKGLTKYLGGS